MSYDKHTSMRELRGILIRLLLGLTVFLIAVLIYKHSDPYAYPGLENRILYALALVGIAILYLYLSDSDACSRFLRAGGVAGVMRDNRYTRLCNDIWRGAPPPVRMVASLCIRYGFILLLLLVVVQSVAPETIPEWADAHLITVTVLLGAVTFYLNRDKLANIVEEARQEEIAEKKRDAEFAERYQRVNRVWGLRRLVRQGYKEGWWYSWVLVVILLIRGTNIFINLDNLPLHQDEICHFEAAYGFKETGDLKRWDFLNQIPGEEYDRNFILTYLVFLFCDIFEFNEICARLPVAIVGFMVIILGYFVTKRISGNKTAALISSYIFSVNDIILYFSRFIRGYIFIILFALILLYLSYKISLSKNIKDVSCSMIPAIAILFISIHFHPTTILVIPFVLLSIIFFLCKMFTFKQYFFIYILFFLFLFLMILNIIGLIDMVPALNYSQHIKIHSDFNIYNFDTIYLEHVTNPYNFSYPFLPIILIILFFINKFNRKIFMLLTVGVYVPLLMSGYLFDRYEDFRYIAVIQPIFIILLSIFIYYSASTVRIDKKYYKLIIILIVFLLIPLQFHNIPQSKPFTHTSITDWDCIDGGRIHRRAAQPESEKAFDWIFDRGDEITILRLADGGINWGDNYYFYKYLKKHPEKKLIFYRETDYYSGKFDEVYNYNKTLSELDRNVRYQKIISGNNTYVVGNLRHLTSRELMDYLDNNCINLAPEIGIVEFDYFLYYYNGKNNYFPNVFSCNNLNSEGVWNSP